MSLASRIIAVPDLSPEDLDKEKAKKRCQDRLGLLRQGLAAMNLALELGDLDQARQLRPGLAESLQELSALIRPGLPSAALEQQAPQAEALQAFRRQALREVEDLDRALAALSRGAWRSAADLSQKAILGRARLGQTICLAAAVLMLAAWAGWQHQRQARLTQALNQAKIPVAESSLKLLSLMTWLAQANDPDLAGRLTDMSQDCAGADLKTILPNHPCRQDWQKNREIIFHSAMPKPAPPLDPCSEIFFDPWQSPYLVLIDPASRRIRVLSPGPSGRLGGPDNISLAVPYWQ